MKALKLTSTLATPYAVIGLSAKDGKLKIESGAVTVNEKALLEILKNLGATGKRDEIVKVPYSKPQTIYFTGLGETYGDDVVAFTNTMNRYMTAIAEPILRNNGCLIKFIGDASLHVHGAPIQEEHDPDHVLAAVRTGLEMLHAVELFNIELTKEGKPLVGCGLGINTGPTLIGNIGSKDRFGYDVLGDSVSLTARLEGQTKNYGVLIIISEFTQARVGDNYFTIELDTIAVKGKSIGVTIYTVFYNPDVTVAADWISAREHHDLMLSYYRQQEWDRAALFCKELKGEFDGKMDDYYNLWIERIAEMRSRDLPSDWDGVHRPDSK